MQNKIRRKSLILGLEITKKCNLRCRYCYIQKGNANMPWEVAKQSIDFAATLVSPIENIAIGFIATEPLMNLRLIRKIVRYANTKGIKQFRLATNALLINTKLIRYFKNNNFSLLVSVDGDELVTNANRVFKNYSGSFTALDKKLELIRKHLNKNYINIRITFTPDTVKYLSRSVEYIANKNLSDNLRINMGPMVVGVEWNKIHFKIFKEEISKINKFFIENLKHKKIYNIAYNECHLLDHVFLKLHGNKNVALEFCGSGEEKLSVDINGDIYPCHILAPSKYKKKENFILGNVWSGILFPQRIYQFHNRQINPCLSCFTWNYLINNDPNKPLKVYREIYKSILTASNYARDKLKY